MVYDVTMLKAFYASYKGKMEHVRAILQRPLTLAEKILYTHLFDEKGVKDYKRGSEVEVTSFGEGLNYSATETLGSATSPNGQVIESTSVYSRISYQVDGYFGVTVPAEKDKLVDIVKNN